MRKCRIKNKIKLIWSQKKKKTGEKYPEIVGISDLQNITKKRISDQLSNPCPFAYSLKLSGGRRLNMGRGMPCRSARIVIDGYHMFQSVMYGNDDPNDTERSRLPSSDYSNRRPNIPFRS